VIEQKMKTDKILELVETYINEKENNWEAGKDWVQYSGPYMDSNEYVNAVKSLLKGWLVMGSDSLRFEKKFPPHLGRKHGILTNSGSSANLLMMSALRSKRLWNFPKGTKVITPIAGFPTTINPIFQNGFEPLFVDIKLDTLNLDVEQVEEAAKLGAKVITFAHVLGNPPNMDDLMSIVEKYDLVLLEDCCDALGSTYKGKKLGSFGEFASCSFYPAHHMTMGEGGFVVTKTCLQEQVIRSFREWGRGCYCVGKKANMMKNGTCKKRFSNWIPELPDEVFDHKYVYEEIGFNLKPIELQSSIGLMQLKKLPEIHRLRKKNFSRLYSIFSKYNEFFVLPKATEGSDPSWFAFPLTVKDSSPFKRKDFTMYLESNKIQTRNYFAGNFAYQPAYKELIPLDNHGSNFPVSTKVTTNTFFLGTSPVITEEQMDYIELVVESFFKELVS
tara:strand:+ start:14995 stop:16326 length:1332 start_codon:yes stop_codon:yes gene_type:complete